MHSTVVFLGKCSRNSATVTVPQTAIENKTKPKKLRTEKQIEHGKSLFVFMEEYIRLFTIYDRLEEEIRTFMHSEP